MPARRKEIEHLFNFGDMGLRQGRVLADVDGSKVELIAVTLGDDSDNILSLITPGAQTALKDRLADLSGARDYVYDWEGPEAS